MFLPQETFVAVQQGTAAVLLAKLVENRYSYNA
jgi:hypothetical protein